jgi:hypothetical protein
MLSILITNDLRRATTMARFKVTHAVIQTPLTAMLQTTIESGSASPDCGIDNDSPRWSRLTGSFTLS